MRYVAFASPAQRFARPSAAAARWPTAAAPCASGLRPAPQDSGRAWRAAGDACAARAHGAGGGPDGHEPG